MFTGIIEQTSSMHSKQKHGDCMRVTIVSPRRWTLAKGVSIAIDGVCSTVTAIHGKYFDVEYMPETLLRTTAASFKKGAIVNLERSLKLGARIDGHLVMGHVDARGCIQGVRNSGKSRELSIAFPSSLRPYIAQKCSIAVNGVALTVTRKSKEKFSVALIPYTLLHTNLGILERGDFVNLEVDALSRSVVEAIKYATVSRYAKKRVRKKR